MSFAALESRVNASVFRHLANAEATLGGETHAVIFKSSFAAADLGMGMASATPTITIASDAVPVSPVGQPVICRGVPYSIAAHEPDGSGISILRLERTA